MKRNQFGIAHYGIVAVLVLVFGVVGVLAFKMVSNSDGTQTAQSGKVKIQPDLPASIKGKADINKTAAAVQDIDTNELDTSVLDADVSALL